MLINEEARMYSKILVPLDGSKLAECVLPHLDTVTKGCGVEEIVLIRVVEPVTLPSGTWTDGGAVITESDTVKTRKKIDDMHKNEAVEYLEGIVQRFQSAGIKTQSVLLEGRPADELVDYIKESDADLTVIASHGRSGIGRWIHGSVAERLLRSVCMPILMVRAPGCVAGL
jgi:nucleotide-binding universal stress UspA family protein